MVSNPGMLYVLMSNRVNEVVDKYSKYIIEYRTWYVGHTFNVSITSNNQTAKFAYDMPCCLDDYYRDTFFRDFKRKVDMDIFGYVGYFHINDTINNRVRRDAPLHTIEDICDMNGVEYDTTHPSQSVPVDIDGETVHLTKNDNLFMEEIK